MKLSIALSRTRSWMEDGLIFNSFLPSFFWSHHTLRGSGSGPRRGTPGWLPRPVITQAWLVAKRRGLP